MTVWLFRVLPAAEEAPQNLGGGRNKGDLLPGEASRSLAVHSDCYHHLSGLQKLGQPRGLALVDIANDAR
jgi:hypothetical protein